MKKDIRLDKEQVRDAMGLDEGFIVESIGQPYWDNLGQTWVFPIKYGKY